MGNPTGFKSINRQLPPDRDAIDRVEDWNEFHGHMSEEENRNQGARCMDCGVPFCHTGQIIGGMTSGCPLFNLIPEWNDLVYHGDWKRALDRLHATNNFPEFTGRVCPAPCEGSCVLGINAPPVAIKHNEVTIIDRGFREGWVTPQPPKSRTGKTVAIVGSGPAGLAAAAQLNSVGHTVTVFERADRIGGLLMYGIPNMKLEKQVVVNRRVNILKQEGITFKTNTEIGKDITAAQLRKDYDAMVLTTGATKPRDLPIEGRDLKGIYFAMTFLTENTKSLLDSKHSDGNFINADGKHVLVIGGGDTGTDCIGTSIRHCAKLVTQLEIMPKASIKRADNNPWPQWPKVYMMDYGQEEAAELQGEDPRVYETMTKKFVGDKEGNVKEAHTVQIEWVKDENGRMSPNEIPGTEKVLKADLVFLAMGFLGPEHLISEQLGIKLDQKSNYEADFGEYTTSIEGVFAAGDCRRGQSLIVWAISEGRQAAKACDKFLMGSTQLP